MNNMGFYLIKKLNQFYQTIQIRKRSNFPCKRNSGVPDFLTFTYGCNFRACSANAVYIKSLFPKISQLTLKNIVYGDRDRHDPDQTYGLLYRVLFHGLISSATSAMVRLLIPVVSRSELNLVNIFSRCARLCSG